MGDFLAIAAGICFSLSQMLAQRGMKHASALVGVSISLIFNNVTYGILLGWRFLAQGFPALPWAGVLYAILGGLFGNILGRTLNYAAIRRIGSARTISLSLSQGLFALLFSILLLSEKLGLWSLMGMALVMGGVFWLSREKVKNEPVRAVEAAAMLEGNSAGAVNPGLQRSVGVIFALSCGLAYSVADLSRKLSMTILPSAIVSSAIGGLGALVVQIMIISARNSWGEFKTLNRGALFYLMAGGILGGLGVITLNAAFSYAPLVLVNSLYNIRVWVPIVLGSIILGTEARISKVVVGSALLVFVGTLLIITR